MRPVLTHVQVDKDNDTGECWTNQTQQLNRKEEKAKDKATVSDDVVNSAVSS